MQRNCQHDTLSKRAIGRNKQRSSSQTSVLFDFRYVLVRQPKSVDLKRWFRANGKPFILLDPPPGLARNSRILR